MSLRGWTGRRRSIGLLGGVLFLVGAVAVLVFLAILAVLGLLVMTLVGIVMGAERLLGLLVPAYRRRHRERYLAMPAGFIRVVRFGSRASPVIEARSYELPRGEPKH
jgi:hypothetical protein